MLYAGEAGESEALALASLAVEDDGGCVYRSTHVFEKQAQRVFGDIWRQANEDDGLRGSRERTWLHDGNQRPKTRVYGKR